jgi:hypothetical protein
MDDTFQDPVCRDERRRGEVRDLRTAVRLNGIDYVESHDSAAPFWLEVVFVKPRVPAGLVNAPGQFRIEGGARVTGIEVTAVQLLAPDRLKVVVDRRGDFSSYRLVIHHPRLDPRLAVAPFRFRASCPAEIDCRQEPECPPQEVVEPALDYLAKDYASFRQLLLDLIPQRNPGWLERNPADLGMVLVELLAYTGDNLSYFQDAVATEAFLDTCRHRVSAKRHARLVDYRMHDGRNAWTFVQLDVSSPGAVLPQETRLLTRVAAPLQRQAAPPGVEIEEPDLRFGSDPALRQVVVFETTAPVKVDPGNNEIRIHTWSDADCCLPRGATGAALYVADGGQARRPALAAGDYLLLEEVKGPATGLEADADPAHRHVVRLVSVSAMEDLVYQEQLRPGGGLQVATVRTQKRLPLLGVTWREEDALPFPFCLSKRPSPVELRENLSVARGNVAPCDHGRTVEEDLDLPVPRGGRSGGMVTRLKQGPLTFQAMPPEPQWDESRLRLKDSRHELGASPREVQPAVALHLRIPPDEPELWTPVPHLLDSTPADLHFVVDVEADGRAEIRFGDDEHGLNPAGVESVHARYRIGNGPQGNLGRDSLAHVVKPDVVPADWPDVVRVRQPLPANGGTAPETIEEVRQLAPRAFHAETFRAVTEEDYEAAALKLPAVAAAKCTFRWTGSWHTVFVAVHPRNPADLVTAPGGRTRLSDGLAGKLRTHLTRYKLAGYDLEVLSARYVPLELAVRVCVAPGHFRGDVLEGVGRALSNRRFASGEVGFFHPSRFLFGQPVYLSRIYALVERVEGVESAVVSVFQRYWDGDGGELGNGVLSLGEGEIARLDNDPSFSENGVLHLSAVGGL